MQNYFAIALIVTSVILAGCSPSDSLTKKNACGLDKFQIGTFITIPTGVFTKSENPLYKEEGAPTRMKVAGFDIQIHEVTNAQFSKFVQATNYETDTERTVKHNGVGAGSALFKNTNNKKQGGWLLIKSATWNTPQGKNSNLDGKGNYPVVHLSHNDAQAYAKWVGGRLPTEVEWEYASSLGLPTSKGQYGGAFNANGKPIANTWQGLFPLVDKGEDGFQGTSPVGCFPPSNIGLFDMIGNVWEWTNTPYGSLKHTIKGGSFLCAPNYCRRYRSAARQPHETDFATNHIGFRIIRDDPLQK